METLYIPVQKAAKLGGKDTFISLPLVQLVNNDAAAASTLSDMLDRFPGLHYTLFYGLKQTANDGHASDTAKSGTPTPEYVMTKAREKLNRAVAGLIRQGGRTASVADPILRRAISVATARWEKLVKDSPAKAQAIIGAARAAENDLADADDETVAEAIIEKMTHAPEAWAAATAFVELEKAKKAGAGDIGDEVAAMFAPKKSKIFKS
jgi:hypothetical protein